MSKPRKVDFFMYDEDFECAYLGALGRSTKCIIGKTKLSGGQISYRLRKAHIRRMDYRDGTSDIATIVERSMRSTLTKSLTKYLS
jgi:hypothetical protein